MILIKFSGGLGNQLYQYSLYRLFQKKYPCEKILADLSDYKLYDVHYGFELEKIFAVEKSNILKRASIWEQIIIRGEIPIFLGGKVGKILETPIAWLNARTRKIWEKKGYRNVIDENIYLNEHEYEKQLAKELQNIDINRNWYINGYWQDECFLGPLLNEVAAELKFPEDADEENRRCMERILATESVGIHVRRGDYVNTPFDIVKMDYYRTAVSKIRELVREPVFFLFSEDEIFLKKEFEWLENKYIVSHNKKENSFRDLQMMSLCKHNIIANSSFSEWAAYFNRNLGKIVIYPSERQKNRRNRKKEADNWIMIETGKK